MISNDPDDEQFLKESNESTLPIFDDLDPNNLENNTGEVFAKKDISYGLFALENLSTFSKTLFKLDKVKSLGTESLYVIFLFIFIIQV
jgi:hypothetical protein